MAWRSWTRGLLTAGAVCLLLPFGAGGCGAGAARGGGSPSASPVGKVLDDTDESGRHLREVGKDDAPEVGIEVTPDPAGGWKVRLRLRHFRLSPAGTAARPAAHRGLAYLFVDGHRVSRLRIPAHHLSLLPHGTHHVTARLYADDGTVWAVHGKPVENTADITASGAETEQPAPSASK